MVTINLIRPSDSDIKFNIIHFPDGEDHIKLDEFGRKEEIIVVTRICCPNDLFILLQVGSILDRAGVIWELYILYLMGMRMDRVMSYNEAFTLEIVANMLNTLNYDVCKVLEAHSDRTKKLINRCTIDPGHPLMDDIPEGIPVYPDAGAFKRYNRKTYIGPEPIICNKTRDVATGNLLKFEIVQAGYVHMYKNLPLIVIDDLCDGGGTFAGIAKLLRDKFPDRQLMIQIVHAVNYKGIVNMCAHFDEVYITNSYRDWDTELSPLPSNLHITELA